MCWRIWTRRGSDRERWPDFIRVAKRLSLLTCERSLRLTILEVWVEPRLDDSGRRDSRSPLYLADLETRRGLLRRCRAHSRSLHLRQHGHIQRRQRGAAPFTA